MCLLIAKPAGVILPKDWAEQCAAAVCCNPDGVGFAIHSPGMRRPKTMRSVDMPSARFAEITAENCGPDMEAVIHFRFGTSGGTRKDLCHPFRLRDGSVFAHNGVLPIPAPPGWSDTYALADSCNNFTELMLALPTYVGPSNKFAAIHRDGGLEIVGEEHGRWHDGLWYSNEYWRDYSWCGEIGDGDGSEDLDWQGMCEIEDSLTAIVERYGFKAVSEYLKLMDPQA